MTNLKLLLKSFIFSSETPVSIKQMQEILSNEDATIEKETLLTLLNELKQDSENDCYELHDSPLGYRFQLKMIYSKQLANLKTEKPPKYPRSILETLAIIAYQQPVTRSDIEEIRGVSVNSQTIKILLEHQWISVIGHKQILGKPALYATTKHFLNHFNLTSIKDLPPLDKLKQFTFEEVHQEYIKENQNTNASISLLTTENTNKTVAINPEKNDTETKEKDTLRTIEQSFQIEANLDRTNPSLLSTEENIEVAEIETE